MARGRDSLADLLEARPLARLRPRRGEAAPGELLGGAQVSDPLEGDLDTP